MTDSGASAWTLALDDVREWRMTAAAGERWSIVSKIWDAEP